ncbi:MAG: ABC transporter substrate-binding protein, partial [Rhodospirillaceae bacterium]|nr:ABC transporter substrate-binding protein [Rhodospirillaceae bacterium]
MKRRTLLAGTAALAGTAGLPIAAQAQARARGNVLRVGVTTFPPGGADPRRSVSVFATYTWSPMFEALTTFSEATELAPELAVAWQATSPTTWHFKLREGAKFSTGRTLTAQDVADNLDWLRTPEAAGSPVQRQLESVTAARAIDPLTVEVTTAYPNAILPREISCLYIVEPGLWRTLGPDGFARAPVGTGPFKLTDWGAAKIVYAPNPHSWRPPQLAGLEILDLPEMTSRLQALVTGQIDVAIGMGPDEQPTIEQAGGRLHERSPHDVISLAFVIGAGSRRAVNPLNDVRVRRALNHAVDKDTIASVILQGRSRAATQGAVRG